MKTLITSIGKPRKSETDNNVYEKTPYSLDNGISTYESPFLFEAILSHHTSVKEPIDQLILVGTVHSCWTDLFKYFYQKKNTILPSEIETILNNIAQHSENLDRSSDLTSIKEFQKKTLSPLIELLENTFHNVKVQIIILQYGLTEAESAYNYKALCTTVENSIPASEENQILLDITHSFRSLPIYLFLVVNYFSRVSKLSTTVSHVYYGIFELKREENLAYTPVINMNYLLTTMDWINGLNELNNYGSVYNITTHCLSNQSTDVKNWLNIFEWATNTNDYNELKKSVSELSSINIDTADYDELEKDALSKISSSLKETFSNDPSNSSEIAYTQLCASKWFFDQRRYGLSIISIQECLRSYLVILLSEDYLSKHSDEEKRRNEAINILKRLTPYCNEAVTLYDYYIKGKDLRNMMAHSLRTNNIDNKNVSDLLAEIEETKITLKDYIHYVESCMNSHVIETAHQQFIDSNKPATISTKLEQIIIVADTKKRSWSTAYLTQTYKTNNIVFYTPANYDVDYESGKNIKHSCNEILTYIDNKVGNHKTLILLGHTNFIKQYHLIKCLHEKYEASQCDIKLLGENKTPSNSRQIILQALKLPDGLI